MHLRQRVWPLLIGTSPITLRKPGIKPPLISAGSSGRRSREVGINCFHATSCSWRAAFTALYQHTLCRWSPTARYGNRQRRLPSPPGNCPALLKQPLTIGNCSISFGLALARAGGVQSAGEGNAVAHRGDISRPPTRVNQPVDIGLFYFCSSAKPHGRGYVMGWRKIISSTLV